MEIKEILALYDQDERRLARWPDARCERDGTIVRHIMTSDDDGLSFVTYSELDEENADAVIRSQVDHFKKLKRGFEWKTFDHDRPADLQQRLVDHGFTAEEPEALMVLELEQTPAHLLTPVSGDVQRVRDRDQLETVRQVVSGVWGGDEFFWITGRLAEYMEEGLVTFYIAMADGEPASAAWILHRPASRFASLYGGSTLARFRGRGLYSALVAARVQEAMRGGYRFLTIDAGELSRPIVEKHGFRLLGKTTPYVMKFE